MAPTLRLLQRSTEVDVEIGEAGHEYWRSTNRTIDPATLARASQVDGVLFGCTATPAPPPEGYESPILALRKHLGLVSNIRYCRRPDGRGIDAVLVRDCAEGLYAGIERAVTGGFVADYRITRAVTESLASTAAVLAMARQRRVVVVHKANVLRQTDGLFRSVALATLASAGVDGQEELADAVGYHLVADPPRYDVLLLTSQVGDILANVGAAMAGGMGLVPSLSLGSGTPLAEPIHGSAPEIAGTGSADPAGMMLSAAILLEHLGDPFGARLRTAVNRHLAERSQAPIRTTAVYDQVSRCLDATARERQ